MKITSVFSHILLIVLLSMSWASCQTTTENIYLAFYNMENLFDTLDDPKTNDNDFLPGSDYQWDSRKYEAKLHNLSTVIAALNNGNAPTALGVCEIENRQVLDDLIEQPLLKNLPLGIVHYESADERGIDVGFIYRKDIFKVTASGSLRPDLSAWNDKTRDVLWVKLKDAKNRNYWVVVCHMPSRREGQQESEPKRLVVAGIIKLFRDSIQKKYPADNFYVMGDFNDEPGNASLKLLTDDKNLNALKHLADKGEGSIKYGSSWNLFDQIISYQGIAGACTNQLNSAEIFSPDWLRQHGNPKFEGSPLRTFGGKKYLNGYSDHFPVGLAITCPLK